MFGYDWPRLHAALNDLPTALLVTAVLFQLLALATRREAFRQASFWTLIVGALGGVAAVLSGLQAEEHIAHGDAVHRVMETHEKLAFVTLGIFAVLALWRLLRERRMGTAERALALAAMLVGAGVLIATASYGGRLVFDHAAGIPTDVLTRRPAPAARATTMARAKSMTRTAIRTRHARADSGHRFGGAGRPCGSPGGSAAQPRTRAGRRSPPSARHAAARALRPVPSPRRLVAFALLAACRPDTTRPAITPYPEAAGIEVRLRPQEATRRLAEALQADSLPPARLHLRDGYRRPSGSTRRRPADESATAGTHVVRLRGWADPGRPGFTVLTVETLYLRPLADPSLPERELGGDRSRARTPRR